MAWPRDNANYLPPEKSKAQLMSENGVGRKVASAATMPGRAGRAAVSALKKTVPGMIVNRLMTDAQGRTANANVVKRNGDGREQAMPNFAAAPTQLLARKREVRGALQADGSRMVIDQRPVAQALPQDRKIPGMGPLQATANPVDGARGKLLSENLAPVPSTHTVYEQDQRGSVIPVQRPGLGQPQASAAAPPPRPQVDQLNGTRRVGGLDITFDADVPLERRQAVMTAPTRPTAQIERYAANAATPRGRNFGPTPIAETEKGPELNTFSDIMREKARRQLIRQDADIANDEGNRALTARGQDISSETSYGTTRMNNENQLENTLLSGQNQLANTTLNNSGNLDNTRLQNSGRLEEVDRTAAGEMQRDRVKSDLDRQAETQKWAATLLEKGVPAETIQRLMNTQPGQTPDLAGIEVPQNTEPKVGRYRDRPIFDADGTQIGTESYDTATGEAASGQQAPNPLPVDQSKRKKGVIYTNSRGQRAVWDGQGLIAVE